jgi:hypothetical protein
MGEPMGRSFDRVNRINRMGEMNGDKHCVSVAGLGDFYSTWKVASGWIFAVFTLPIDGALLFW